MLDEWKKTKTGYENKGIDAFISHDKDALWYPKWYWSIGTSNWGTARTLRLAKQMCYEFYGSKW